MNFWERVVFLLEQKNISRKELSLSIGFNNSNIRKGILNNNIPSADTAVKIAKYLNTSVEFLVTGNDPLLTQSEQLEDLISFYSTIESLKSIPKERRILIEKIIQQVSLTYQKK